MFFIFASCPPLAWFVFFFFNDTATTEIYTLSLHDALPICRFVAVGPVGRLPRIAVRIDPFETAAAAFTPIAPTPRSEEHTSELQSRLHLVCRLLLEKKKKPTYHPPNVKQS